ncbi:Crp/Fnr family transcriptional regulator [Hymenobacter rubripertinctus]|uniref:Crp/Fnr family transcriptional regulator n=1 Tax=Hymenobacter rubripertinctus TaxID=2029981 RepID=A0A418R7A7_9BACT|nr:Crp/Fnr family transcriptional regulator [Hymenobacter rubripertinctus]RIY13470.1 Crp/Fnr family transcriptional regulator [Hymenobacter rubripertinctus]
MSQEKLQHFLQSTGVINAGQAQEVAAYFTPRTLLRQELLLRTGQISQEYLLLTSGYVRAFACDPEGLEVTTAFTGPGQVALEVSSFFTRVPSLETIQALTDCEGWTLTHEQMNQLFHGRPEFREFGRGVLVRGFAALKNRMLEMITTTAAVRYDRLLAASPEILQHASLKMVASYLGVTDTSLSRIRKVSSQKEG